MNGDRELPASMEAERNVLGSLLIEPTAFDRVVAIVKPEDFRHDAHRAIFGAIVTMEGKGVDLTTLKDAMRDGSSIERAVGSAYISGLLDGIPDSANVERYARIVAEKSLRRRVITECHRLEAAAFSGEPIADIAAKGAVTFSDVSRVRDEGPQPIRAIAKRTMQDLERKMQGGDWITGIPSGLSDIDTRTLGLSRGVLSVIGARPRVGKTALAIGTSFAAVAAGYRVMFIELDMSEEMTGKRMLATISGVDAAKVRHGQGISTGELQRISQAASELYQLDDRILFDYQTRGIAKICALAKREARNGGIDLIVVDHIGHVRGGKGERRDLEIADVSSRLIELAGDTQAAVLALVQLKREADQREPSLVDLRESGSLEQDARLVMLLDRPALRDGTVPQCRLDVYIPKAEGEAGHKVTCHFGLRNQRITQEAQDACSYCGHQTTPSASRRQELYS